MRVKQRNTGASRRTVNHNKNTKRVLIAVSLALIGLTLYTVAVGYTHQEKQKAQLQRTLQELRVKQQQLDSNRQEGQRNLQEIERLKKELQAKKDGQARALAEAAQKPVQARVAVSNPQCLQWMAEAGLPISAASTRLILNESGCRYNAVNPSSGACGIPQSYPCSKLPCTLDAAGAVCQLRWMQQYITSRYGTWENALAMWNSRSPHWY